MLAKGLGCPVLALHQLSRGVEQHKPPRPILADLRQIGDIENHSDIVLFWYRPAYDADKKETRQEAEEKEVSEHEAEAVIAKHRGGPTARIIIAWDGPTMTFSDLDKNHEAG